MDFERLICYNRSMSQAEKRKILIDSISRSMEAEGFNFAAVKTIIEQKLDYKE